MELDFFVADPERNRVLVDVVKAPAPDRLVRWLGAVMMLSSHGRCRTNVLAITLCQDVAEHLLAGVHTVDRSWRPYVIGPEPHPLEPGSIYAVTDASYDLRVSHVREAIGRLADKRGVTIESFSQRRLRDEQDLRTLELWLLSVASMERPGCLSFSEC